MYLCIMAKKKYTYPVSPTPQDATYASRSLRIPLKGSPEDIWYSANKVKTFSPNGRLPITKIVNFLGEKINPNLEVIPKNLVNYKGRDIAIAYHGGNNTDEVSKSTGSTTSDLSNAERGVMARLAWNAYNRTGKQQGGTTYNDYRNLTDARGNQELTKIQAGNPNPIIETAKSFIDPVTRMATYVGQASYTMDPENKNVLITDKYDFKNPMSTDKNGKMKKGYLDKPTNNAATDFYRSERKKASQQDEGYNMPMPNIKFSIPISDTQYYTPPVAPVKRFGGSLFSNIKAAKRSKMN